MQVTPRPSSRLQRALLALGVASSCAAAGCAADPCQTYALDVQSCPEFVDVNSTSSSTGAGTPTTTCSDHQQTIAKCLLQSGIDPCTIVFHPDKLTDAQRKTVDACKASM